ncbi:unnamed protein product [Arctia plantaginis]|uniref:Cytochrome P450 n=1 Tax=Arctia plantaginis TaxID=874455 RepID=A0A8S1BA63_ARCPL|nr:unnamed protein product [Arctia plantaginis]
MLRKIPGPPYEFLFGNSLKILCSSADLMKLRREFAKTWNGIYRIWIPTYGAVIIFNPEDIEAVISDLQHNGKSNLYLLFKSWLQDGLLMSKGSKWQERRKILTPAFHFKILHNFCGIIEENSQRLLENLKLTVGQPINIVPVVSEFTLNSICETAMGTKLKENGSAGKTYKEAIHSLGSLFMRRLSRFYLYSDFVFNLSPCGKEQQRHLNTVHNFTKNVIEERKVYADTHGLQINDENLINDEDVVYKKRTALLDLLISAEKDGLIDRQGIQEEVDTFMFEGHDTTASGLTFCLMLLANHKEVQDNIVSELDEIFEGSNRSITMGDLSKMKYLECCIKESLRLYPPVHFISRALTKTAILSNYKVPSGTMCHIDIMELHHRADLFPDPEKFDPERFLPENSVNRHPYAYIPFSAGPRNCIGQKFAMMEMKITIAATLREFELEPVTLPTDLVFIADLVLRNQGPVRVKFVKRLD